MNFAIDDLVDVSGLSRRTITRWKKDCIIRTENSDAKRPSFTWATAFGCSLGGALIRAGVGTSVVSKVIEWCQDGQLHRQVLAGHNYLICNRHQAFLSKDGALFAKRRGEDVAAVVVDLPAAVRVFQAAVERQETMLAEAN